jgi:hypothetical protein
VDALNRVLVGIGNALEEWRRVVWRDLHFAQTDSAITIFIVLLAAAVLLLIVRRARRRVDGRAYVALPAILPVMRRSRLSATRHGALFVFLAGVPFFAVALADPLTSLRHDEVSYPGRRIALVIDASTSMVLQFETPTLHTQSKSVYFTAVAAAERFMRLRMAGPYHDLISLIQFGNDAYVMTPFTTDYENVLLSLSLIGNPREWGRFNDQGTTIIVGIDEALSLFAAFDFLNASGNALVLITDGRDDQLKLRGQRLDEMMLQARRNKIPIYMLRTAAKMKLGQVPQDQIWKDAMERTGGRFYPVSDEQELLAAIRDIDRLSAGRIDVRQYTSERPQFAGYAVIALGFWLTAALLKLAVPHFRTFP